jgi:N-acetylglucosaminyldiphosphoundecaprenol N-acetyl-beta-D-mannosaminyltransferase
MYREILGSRIDAVDYAEVCDRIQSYAESTTSCYVVAANVHVVMTGYWQPEYQRVINGAALVTPDGMPLVWAMRLLGVRGQTRVYGPDLMLHWCQRAAETGLPIYLYGGTPAMLAKLEQNLTQRFPSLAIAGSCSPPFRELTSVEMQADAEKIQASGARVIFVGLGCPKQEFWMAQQLGQINAVMIGVGAAFSFHSGEVSQAPRWMMGMGLEWLYRLMAEPGRLWRRYLINNPAFVLLFSWQWLTQVFNKSKSKG